MTFIFKDNSLSSDQDINQFLIYMRIESQISYTTIKDFTNRTINITLLSFFSSGPRRRRNGMEGGCFARRF